IGPRASGAASSVSGTVLRWCGVRLGRVHCAVRRAEAGESCDRMSARLACPRGVGPQKRHPAVPATVTNVPKATMVALATAQYRVVWPASAVDHGFPNAVAGWSGLSSSRKLIGSHLLSLGSSAGPSASQLVKVAADIRQPIAP